ncbi:MAG: NACHT domain-containing protein [Rhizomicrobium sp.]
MNWQLIFQGAIGSLIAGVSVAVILRFADWRSVARRERTTREKFDREFPKRLLSYLGHLRTRTLQINHPWMKEGQTLGEILVPIGLIVDDERVDLRALVSRAFQTNHACRLLLLGAPGSGKSIAMGEIARFLPILRQDSGPTPIMLTFSDLKGAATDTDLERVVADKLRRDRFTESKADELAPMQFITNRLYSGQIVLLFDGYDELERDQRATTARFVREFLTTHNHIPAVLASRTAVYEREHPFGAVITDTAAMASFSPLAIARFVFQWRFDEGKSAQELLGHINGKAHLNELAANPLMLTIICFLYSQPKYLLPDNRVEFYRECCRALLEKWDLAMSAGRANQFETDHKMNVLSRIAYRHISDKVTTDEEIKANEVGIVTRDALQALSINPSLKDKIIREIIENSGLLVELPPDGFRFPHRTFLEFFAAVYLYEQEKIEQVLSLYRSDEARWRPTLLMYAGLCKSRENTVRLLAHLSEDFAKSQSRSLEPDVTVFSALIESSFAPPEVAEGILLLARNNLSGGNSISLRLVEELGYIAANARWIYSKLARNILRDLLAKPLGRKPLQTVISAAMRCRTDEAIRTTIATRLEDLDLVEFFIEAGQQAAYYLHRLLELGLDTSRKLRLVTGLLEGNHLDLVANIMIESSDAELAVFAGRALQEASENPGFEGFLDGCQFRQFSPDLAAELERFIQVRHWPLPQPATESGRLLALAIGYYASQSSSVTSDRWERVPYSSGQEHEFTWLDILVQIFFLQQKGIRAVDLTPDVLGITPLNVLVTFWNKLPARDLSWNRFWRTVFNANQIFRNFAGILVNVLVGFSLVAELGIFLQMIRNNLPTDSIVLLGMPVLAALAAYLHWSFRWNQIWLLALSVPVTFLCIFLASVSRERWRESLSQLVDSVRVGDTQPIWYAARFFQTISIALVLTGVAIGVSTSAFLLAVTMVCNGIVLACWVENKFIVVTALFGGAMNNYVRAEILRSSLDVHASYWDMDPDDISPKRLIRKPIR